MLSIKTDLENTSWLSYLMEEFKRIQHAEFEIQITPMDGVSEENDLIYAYNNTDGTSVFNSREAAWTGKIQYIDEQVYVLEGTLSDNPNYTCNYDLFWNAFVFLSRLEEYDFEERGGWTKSYCSRHPREDKASFEIPIVTHLFHELETLITKEFPHLKFESGNAPIIELSHDIDYIEKTIQLRLKQTAFNAFNTIKSLFNPQEFIRGLLKTMKFFFSTPSYWCFDYWCELEKSHGKRSVYFVYVKAKKNNFTSWLIDPSYDIRKNEKLQKKLKDLSADGFEIGLHGSFRSAADPALLKREKEILEGVLGIKVNRTRQHWLNYQEGITPYSHDENFELDSTLAWNDQIGYRAGCVSRFRPYDHKNLKAFTYFEIPQVIMDSNIYDYGSQKLEQRKELCRKLLKNLKNYKNANVAISWHQRVSSSDYRWHELYEELIRI